MIISYLAKVNISCSTHYVPAQNIPSIQKSYFCLRKPPLCIMLLILGEHRVSLHHWSAGHSP